MYLEYKQAKKELNPIKLLEITQHLIDLLQSQLRNIKGKSNPTYFIVLMNNANDNNPNLTEAMNGPDSTGFMGAMEKEIKP